MGYDRIVYIRYHFSCGLDRKDACWLSFTPLTGFCLGQLRKLWALRGDEPLYLDRQKTSDLFLYVLFASGLGRDAVHTKERSRGHSSLWWFFLWTQSRFCSVWHQVQVVLVHSHTSLCSFLVLPHALTQGGGTPSSRLEGCNALKTYFHWC